MAKRKRADYVAPSVRQRPPRPVPEAAPEEPVSYFPPGTWKKVLVGGLLGAVALAGVTAFVLRGQQADRRLAATLTAGSCTTDTRTDPGGGQGHVKAPAFRVDPPSGGDHARTLVKAGTYAGSDVPDDGRLVHALEHGYVVLWHRPGVPTAELARLARQQRGDVIVAERASLPVPVAATAWESRLLCQQVEPRALAAFVEARVGDGPEDVRRG